MSEDVSVTDLIELIKNPTGEPGERRGACIFAKTVAKLPQEYQEALEMVMADTSVKHGDVVSFVNNHTDERVTLSAVQRHRNKQGCHVCLYGEPS